MSLIGGGGAFLEGLLTASLDEWAGAWVLFVSGNEFLVKGCDPLDWVGASLGGSGASLGASGASLEGGGASLGGGGAWKTAGLEKKYILIG